MKGRVFYGIAVAVSDRAVAVQDRAEIPHLKDGLLLDFRADQRALRAAHQKEQRVFPMRRCTPDGCRCACRTGG